MKGHAPRYFAGIDLGSQQHQVCLTDEDGVIVDEWIVQYTGLALGQLADRLIAAADGEPSRVVVALEVPHGAVVETLMDRGLTICSINPKQLDRFRDRFSPSGAKDDRRDAQVLASAVRTDRQSFRELEAEDPQVIELRELARSDTELRQELLRQSNRLRAQTHRYYPQLLELCPAMNEPWAWALLELAPTPDRGRRLRRPRIEGLLRAHRIRRLSAAELHTALQSPAPQVAAGVTEAVSARAILLVAQLQLLHAQRSGIRRQLKAALTSLQETVDAEEDEREHRDVDIILSMPGIGITVAATMLAEAQRALRERDYHRLRVQAGVAPVTKASGTRRTVVMRRACNRRLGEVMYHMGRVAAQFDPGSREYYGRLRARGHRHARAVRSVADRQLRILVAMLRDGALYDASRHERSAEKLPLAA